MTAGVAILMSAAAAVQAQNTCSSMTPGKIYFAAVTVYLGIVYHRF